jgi:multidrug resistance efflux pump
LQHITTLEAQVLQYQSRIAYLEESSFLEKKTNTERVQQLQELFEHEKQQHNTYENEVKILQKKLQDFEKLQYQVSF